MISTPIVWWCLAAALLFWSVGAYNRLVRLRAQAYRAFAAVALLLLRYAEITAACESAMAQGADASGTQDPALLPQTDGNCSQAWSGLSGALNQFSASLAAARARPLHGASVMALAAADQVLQSAWQRVLTLGLTRGGSPLPETLPSQWQDTTLQIQPARAVFAQAIESYNAAVEQFPARLLAWLFGFRAAKTL